MRRRRQSVVSKTQKRRNEQNAALNRDNETESHLRHQREVARITAMQYADAAVRNAALERENERHKKQWHGRRKSQGLLQRRGQGDCFAVQPATGAD